MFEARPMSIIKQIKERVSSALSSKRNNVTPQKPKEEHVQLSKN